MTQTTASYRPSKAAPETYPITGSGPGRFQSAEPVSSHGMDPLSRDEIIAEALGKLQAIVGRRDLANLTAAEEDTLLRRLKAASWRE